MIKPLVIAEIGINHYGSVETAMLLIRLAKKSGADAVKFQAFTANELEPPGEMRRLLKSRQFTVKQLKTLRDYAKKQCVLWGVTPYSVDWTEVCVNELNPDFLKISSGGIRNEALVKSVCSKHHMVFASVGMAEKKDLERLILWSGKKQMCLMKCTSAYPTASHDSDVSGMDALRAYAEEVGLSCHSNSPYPAITATARGAFAIEKHIALERHYLDHEPDLRASMLPNEFKNMVEMIREVAKTIGDPSIGLKSSEFSTINRIKNRELWAEKRKVL
jgi:sialic acid synthase SpsE